MAIAYVSANFFPIGGSGGTNRTNFPSGGMDSTGGNLAIYGGNSFSGLTSPSQVTDAFSNTYDYTANPLNSAVGIQNVQIFYAKNATVGASHWQEESGVFFDRSFGYAFSGASTTAPFDQTIFSGSVGTVNSFQVGSLTPPSNGALFVTVLGSYVNSNGGSSLTIDSSFAGTLGDGPLYNGNGNDGQGAIANFCQSTAGAKNPTWGGMSNSGSPCATMATFVVASAAATVRQFLPMLGVA